MAKNSRNYARRKDQKIAQHHYKRKFEWLNACVYCGQGRECLDHVFPISIATGLDFSNRYVRESLKRALCLVPCCNSCNLIALNKPFETILQKRAYIQKRLRQKNQEKLRTVLWDADEIEELGYNMRVEVLKMLNNRFVLEKRINHPYKIFIPKDIEGLFKFYEHP